VKASILLLVAALLFATSSAMLAQQNVEQVFASLEQQAKLGEGPYLYLITGAGVAYSWANVANRGGTVPLYCPPKELTLNQHNYVQIALQEYKKGKDVYAKTLDSSNPADILSYVLLWGLARTFPCK